MSTTNDPKSKKLLYQIAIDGILKKIEINDFSFELPICTEKKLMEQYDISRITAKRAITELENQHILYRKRGVGSFVSRDIYSQNTIASKNTPSFAFVLPFEITKGGLTDTFQTANTILNDAGFGASIYITASNSASRGRTVLSRLLESDITGIVYYPNTNNIHLELLNQFVMAGKPVVVMDINTECPYVHSVTSDNYNGSKLLTKHLLSLGHKKIGYLSGFAPESRTTICDRFGGYLSEMRKGGIPLNADYVITDLGLHYRESKNASPFSTPLHKAIARFTQLGVTAIETENDELAFYTIMACQEMGISVPEQLSVCGFDNSQVAYMLTNGITTVSQNFAQIGKRIADILLASVSNASLDTQRIVVPTALVIQGSSSSPVSMT